MATALRKGPYQTNLLLAGHDDYTGASLYFIDYLAAMTKTNFAAHGYCASFVLAVMDREWRPKMDLDAAKVVISKCIHELKMRFLINQPNFIVKMVDSNGIKEIVL